MSYPNPTFLTKASDIRGKRRTRTIIAVVVLVILALLITFVLWGAHMQQIYAEKYPELVGAATAETTTIARRTTAESTTETEETSEETTTTSALAPIIGTDETTETTSESTMQVNIADQFVETDPVYFRITHPLQTITHEERDVKLDVLKQQVQDYITNHPNERICFRYVNLNSNETLGLNDLYPVLPGGAIALPVELAYYNKVDTGFLFPLSTVTYYGETAPGGSSFIADTYTAGKPFFLRTLANLAIARNDNLALQYLIDTMGGMEKIWLYISEISNYIDYTENLTYTSINGRSVGGNGRTSCFDLAEYASFLYYGYLNNAELYQPLVNDMYNSTKFTPYRTAFGDDAIILHVAGRNEQMHAYTDVAIIDCDEPIVLAISCECLNYDRGNEIITDLSSYVAQYISSCHTN